MKKFKVNFTQASEQHLTDLRDYISAKSSRRTADRYIRAIVQEARELSKAPFRGESRSGLKHELRTIGFRRSVSLVFRIGAEQTEVDIIAVLYRGRLPAEAWRYEHHEERDELH